MVYTRTLSQLSTGVQTLGNYENSGDITPAILLQVINDALVETYDICLACRDDFYARIGSPFTLVNGQDTYALPVDFYELRKVELQYSPTRWVQLLPVPVDGTNQVSQFGMTYKRYRYRLSNQGLTLYPTPASSTDVVRVYYNPLAPQLALLTDSVTFDRPQEQKLVEHIALRDLYMREDLATTGLDQKIEMLRQQLRTSADTHDAGEPFYLSGHGPDGDDWEY